MLMEHVRRLIKCTGENLQKAQARDKRNYESYVRPTVEQLNTGDFVLVRREALIKRNGTKFLDSPRDLKMSY